MPENKRELGGHDKPSEDEKPFYCLLSNDKLISHTSVETDTLLQPTSEDLGWFLGPRPGGCHSSLTAREPHTKQRSNRVGRVVGGSFPHSSQ
jgi:hypothetical protein